MSVKQPQRAESARPNPFFDNPEFVACKLPATRQLLEDTTMRDAYIRAQLHLTAGRRMVIVDLRRLQWEAVDVEAREREAGVPDHLITVNHFAVFAWAPIVQRRRAR